MSYTTADVIAKLPPPAVPRLPAPPYQNTPNDSVKLVLGVESMKRHMTDEGWQLQIGLAEAGYRLCGRNLDFNHVDVRQIVQRLSPSVIMLQDKREWDPANTGCWDKLAAFKNVEFMQSRREVFKITVVKDAHQRPDYHRNSAREAGIHAWIVYYHPAIVARQAPYVRPEHMLRVYHTVDPRIIPEYSPNREGCFLSGAVSGVYPLRKRLVAERAMLPDTYYLPHPGYGANGSSTPDYLETLAKFKVAICTASTYGYALRKLIEATACGCVVLTDLPEDEVLPEIDGNLIRVHPDTSTATIAAKLVQLMVTYDPDRQRDFAAKAKAFYDYRLRGRELATSIEALRSSYK